MVVTLSVPRISWAGRQHSNIFAKRPQGEKQGIYLKKSWKNDFKIIAKAFSGHARHLEYKISRFCAEVDPYRMLR
jgi:hypothetical protein